MVEEPDILRRGFGKLLGGLLGSSVAPSDLLNYVKLKDVRVREHHRKVGERILQENLNGSVAEDYFAKKIGETLQLGRLLGIESIEEFYEAINRLSDCPVWNKDGYYTETRYSQ